MAVEVNVCPGTLKEGQQTYTARALKELFKGRKVDHVLPFEKPDGVQELRLKLDKKKLVAADDGNYVVRLVDDSVLGDQLAANAHLSMQLAKQVFDIPVAPNAMIFFADGTPAYVSRDADQPFVDFVVLANADPYRYSYYDMSLLIDRHAPAAIAAKEHFFRQVVFNYLIGNGDAHLKKFGLVDVNGDGDWQMAPAFDLVNTALHGDTGDLALLDGLYPKDHEKMSYKAYGYYAYDDFYQFGMKMGIVSFRVKRFMDQLLSSVDAVRDLVGRSFLSNEAKQEYLRIYALRHTRLSNSLSGLYLR